MSKELENLQEQANWHWRNSMLTVRFFNVDARATFPFLILFFRLTDLKVWALVFATLFFFRFLEKKGLTVPAAWRSFRLWITGRNRPGWVGAQQKRFRDFG